MFYAPCALAIRAGWAALRRARKETRTIDSAIKLFLRNICESGQFSKIRDEICDGQHPETGGKSRAEITASISKTLGHTHQSKKGTTRSAIEEGGNGQCTLGMEKILEKVYRHTNTKYFDKNVFIHKCNYNLEKKYLTTKYKYDWYI